MLNLQFPKNAQELNKALFSFLNADFLQPDRVKDIVHLQIEDDSKLAENQKGAI